MRGQKVAGNKEIRDAFNIYRLRIEFMYFSQFLLFLKKIQRKTKNTWFPNLSPESIEHFRFECDYHNL